jgi:O-antigen/teichoic acid export membrane protein
MNVIQKQSFFNSITLYLGILLGFFNSIILFQRFLTLEEIGYFGLLTTISVLYNQVSSLGITSVITRYFTFYKTDDKLHGGFPRFVISLAIIGFSIVTLGFIFFKEVVFSFYTERKGMSLMSKYYYYIIPVSLFTLVFLIQETIARTAYKSIFPGFLREVVVKIFTSIGILLIVVKWIDYRGFIHFYIGANVLIVLVIVWYNQRIKIYKPSSISTEVRGNAKTMINYGFYSMISGSAIALIPGLGLIILKLLSGEAMVGIYVTFTAIATVISLPAKALNITSYQIIADAWKTEDLNRIGKIYYKTSIIQLLIGCLLLIGLISNQRNLLYLLHKPEYVGYFYVFVLLGCGFLVDITGGLNGAIISFSKHFRVIMWFLLAAVGVSLVINYTLISKFGLIGAACSYVLTMLFLNTGYWLYLKLKFNLQPFNLKHVLILLISSGVLLVGLSLPELDNYYLDVVYRSLLITVLYAGLSYFFNISEDINDLVNKVLKRKSN